MIVVFLLNLCGFLFEQEIIGKEKWLRPVNMKEGKIYVGRSLIFAQLLKGNGYKAWQTSERQRCEDLCWMVLDRA